MTIKPIRIQFKTACELLDISRESLRHIVRTDASFPRPIKTGESKQSAVFFDYAELLQWYEAHKTASNGTEVFGIKPSISSLKLAHDLGIRHADLMRKIRKLHSSTDVIEPNFSFGTYTDTTGQTLAHYKITQQGFTFLISPSNGYIHKQYVEQDIRAFEAMAQQIAHAEQSLYTQLNKTTLQYMLVAQGASHAGRNLNYLGKIAKPRLRKKILDIMDQLQLKLPFESEEE